MRPPPGQPSSPGVEPGGNPPNWRISLSNASNSDLPTRGRLPGHQRRLSLAELIRQAAEIANASMQQSQGVDQINGAIEQANQVTSERRSYRSSLPAMAQPAKAKVMVGARNGFAKASTCFNKPTNGGTRVASRPIPMDG